MSHFHKKFLLICFSFALCYAAHASFLDDIGVMLLRTTGNTNLDGTGIRVGQVEAQSGANIWEVRPGAVGLATNVFTYYNGIPPSITNTFPNALGVESGHANAVAANFYGLTTGVATNVLHVDNYEANTFLNYYINGSHAISNKIVNQSFTYGSYDTNVDGIYDNYAAQKSVLFVTGSGFNANPVWSPATCYNGIGVGVAGINNSSYGPTPDGRSKPDIIAPYPPDASSSYTTAEVSGAATVLCQAAKRGDGGGDTNSASDLRVLKALLLNGAVKPSDWTNSPSTPFHTRYGAGVLNVFNSYQQLIGGKRTNFFPTAISGSNPHPPVSVTNTIPVLNGWDFQSIASSMSAYNVNHYFFNVTNGGSDSFIVSAMLVWNKQAGETGINNLDLFLYNCANSNLVACSTSLVDNVEHIFLPRLAQGRYDLQVLMRSGGVNPGNNSETYALAFEFAPTTLSVLKSGTNVNLSWPIYPAGFMAEATTNLVSQNWRTNGIATATVTNSQNVISIPATNANRFFRLRMPNF